MGTSLNPHCVTKEPSLCHNDLKYLYFNRLKGETLSASHYRSKGFEQNVNDCDFFEESIIFQPYDDSTFNYQYCYQDLINYPYMK